MIFTPHQNSQYRIVSALDNDMVLDCAPNNHVCLWKWHKGANQRWRIINTGNGKYGLQNVQHANFMKTANNSNGAECECHISKKQANQIWELIPCNQAQYHGKHAFYLKSHCGKALDVCEGKAQNGTKIIQWDYNGHKNQVWYIDPIGFIPSPNTAYKIISALDHKYALDVSQNPKDFGNLILWPWSGTTNQKYYFTPHNGKFFMISYANHHSVQIPGGNDNERIRTGAHNKQNYQLFEIIPANHPQFKQKEAFYIKTHAGKFLDVSGEKAKNQSHIIQWGFNGNKNQIWFIEKA